MEIVLNMLRPLGSLGSFVTAVLSDNDLPDEREYRPVDTDEADPFRLLSSVKVALSPGTLGAPVTVAMESPGTAAAS